MAKKTMSRIEAILKGINESINITMRKRRVEKTCDMIRMNKEEEIATVEEKLLKAVEDLKDGEVGETLQEIARLLMKKSNLEEDLEYLDKAKAFVFENVEVDED